MVRIETKTIWICPYCESEYDTEDRAFDCAQSCVDIDRPEEKTTEIYFCEMCDKQYEEENDAEECEENHVETNDRAYQLQHHKDDMQRLYVAGTQQNQSSLLGERAVWKEKKKIG